MKNSLVKNLGPGLLFAGAAIGVSHLVQSTRVGADFGYGLLWAIFFAHVFKYPFFQYGPRYAAATGETLLEGYRKLGKGVLIAYFILNFATMFTIQAAVTIVTAALASHVFGLTSNLVLWSVALTIVSMLILIRGKYQLLDRLMKYIVVILTISTLIAVAVAFSKNTMGFNVTQILPKGTVEITFLIAFLGWMPAPLDISIWHSLWSKEKDHINHSKSSVKEAIFDFNVGYIGALFMGVCFVILGALVMFPSGESFSNKGGEFAAQLIKLYTHNLGAFSGVFIAIAAFTTMFSTTITTLDASPRAMAKTCDLLRTSSIVNSYLFWIVLLGFGTFVILQFFSTEMGLLVKIATVLSFLTAPFYAILNFVLVKGKHMPKEDQPGLFLTLLSWLGIIFLIGFSIWFLINF